MTKQVNLTKVSTFMRITVQKAEEAPVVREGGCDRPLLEALSGLLGGSCRGTGKCGECRVTLTGGVWRDVEGKTFAATLEAPWEVLACRVFPVSGNLSVSIKKPAFQEPDVCVQVIKTGEVKGRALALAIDVGSTTIKGAVLAGDEVIRTASVVNDQYRVADSVIDRIADPDYGGMRRRLISSVKLLIYALIQREKPEKIVIAANPVMSCYLAGLPVDSLGRAPFEAPATHFEVPDDLFGAPVTVFPVLAGLVGGDIASGLHSWLAGEEEEYPQLFLDLGTNCEMALLTKDGISVASAAAGPAFERSFRCPWDRSATRLRFEGGRWIASGEKEPYLGMTGSALIDWVAIARREGFLDEKGVLDAGMLQRYGLAEYYGGELRCRIAPGLAIGQREAGNLLMAIAAVRAGLEILIEDGNLSWGWEEIKTLTVAGNFASSLDYRNACDCGLLRGLPETAVRFPGNTALAGAIRAVREGIPDENRWRHKIRHVDLAQHPKYWHLLSQALGASEKKDK